jgi:hypothetical protein
MKCPHCGVGFHDDGDFTDVAKDVEGTWEMEENECPECHHAILRLHLNRIGAFGPPIGSGIVYGTPPRHADYLVWPTSDTARICPPEVDEGVRTDFQEAVGVLPISPKASAALSRRVLQTVLRDKCGANQHNLIDQIQHVLDGRTLPPYLNEQIDAIRVLGNFAAHPIKSTSTGEIVEVEVGEAEWNLDVLELLFDVCYVQPSVMAQKKADLNAKLADANKPPLKS